MDDEDKEEDEKGETGTVCSCNCILCSEDCCEVPGGGTQILQSCHHFHYLMCKTDDFSTNLGAKRFLLARIPAELN